MNNNVIVTVKDSTKRNKRFENLCELSQADLKIKLEKELIKIAGENNVLNRDGYLYAEGNIPILVTAHLDTVHKELPKEIIYSDGCVTSPQGIGGDDRCGVYIIMELLKDKDKRPHVLFCEDEEIGGVGSEKFVTDHQSPINDLIDREICYCIDIDRKGNNDAVYYELENESFEDFISKRFWQTAYGSFTDICNICPKMKVAGVNLSCGYYKQHTKDEYVVLKEMEKALREIKALIARTTENDRFEWIECERYGRLYGYYDDDSYTDLFGGHDEYLDYEILYVKNGEQLSYYTMARSEAEAIGFFVMEIPKVTYEDILYVSLT